MLLASRVAGRHNPNKAGLFESSFSGGNVNITLYNCSAIHLK